MLLHNNYEVSKRTSLEYPYAHKDGGTIFLPINITEAEIPETLEDGTETTAAGYAFEEHRINEGAELPADAVNAIIDAFVTDEEALKLLGLGGI